MSGISVALGTHVGKKKENFSGQLRLAKADDDDFTNAWEVFYALQALEDACDEEEVWDGQKLIAERLEKLGQGGFSRIVHGCQVLIDNCCDKKLDHYAFHPDIERGMDMFEKAKGNS